MCYGDERKFPIQFDDIQQWDQDNWISTLKKKKKNLDPYLIPQRLTQSRLYIDLNVRAKTIRLKRKHRNKSL